MDKGVEGGGFMVQNTTLGTTTKGEDPAPSGEDPAPSGEEPVACDGANTIVECFRCDAFDGSAPHTVR